MALALFGDGLLKLIGIICNVEMADMFENPLGTVNIRLFWSHWNRAIATVLHRVIFGGGRNTKTSVKSQKKAKNAVSSSAQDKRLAQLRQRRHLDQLSETEVDTGKTDDEDDGAHSRRARQNGLTMTKSAVNGDSKPSQPRSSSKSRSSFAPKAFAAIATFAMSGIFHEWITAMTINYASGENFVFFVLNGVATVVSTWFRRSYPELNAKIPTLVAVLMLHAFFLAVIPLFCAPFIQRGFFVRAYNLLLFFSCAHLFSLTELNALRYELLPWQARKRGAFIYLFGQ